MKSKTTELRLTLNLAIEEYLQIRKLIKEATLLIRNLSKQESFIGVQEYLQSIPEIGLILNTV